jgi:hypothetical protein
VCKAGTTMPTILAVMLRGSAICVVRSRGMQTLS